MYVGLVTAQRKPENSATAVPALVGAPATHRWKTYSGAAGRAFQYRYLGFRQGHLPQQPHLSATAYVFAVSADRRPAASVSVWLPDETLSAWEQSADRALRGNERYAIAKLLLFLAFDETESAWTTDTLVLQSQELDTIVKTLDWE